MALPKAGNGDETDDFVPSQLARRAGPYLLLEVPNDQPKLKTSFLRLGSSKNDWRSQPGADLAQMFSSYADDPRQREPDWHTTPEQRAAITANLFDKGGWWDHSGGNRITTTDGDKLEIVRGNYLMKALGRQHLADAPSEDFADGAGIEISGGIIKQPSRMPVSTKFLGWTDTWGGTWTVKKETKRGDYKDTFWGNRKSRSYGDHFETVIGSDAPGHETPNPKITEKTWAKSLKEYKGSSSKPIDSIDKKTHINNITEETFALALSSSTQALTIQSATIAGLVTEEQTSLLNTSLEVGALRQGASLLATSKELSVVGAKVGVNVVPLGIANVDVVGLAADVDVGARINAKIGDRLAFRLGGTLDLDIANYLNLNFAIIKLGLAITPLKLEAFLGFALNIGLLKFKIGLNEDEEPGTENTWMGLKFDVF